jgi:hypothetical protein
MLWFEYVQTLFPVDSNGENFTTYMGIILTWIQSIIAVNIALAMADSLERMRNTVVLSLQVQYIV